MLTAGEPEMVGAWLAVGEGVGVGVGDGLGVGDGVGDGLGVGDGVSGIVTTGVEPPGAVAPDVSAPVGPCVAFALDASPPPPPHAASEALSRMRLVRWKAWRLMFVCMSSVPRFSKVFGESTCRESHES
jgi:hypothetical protein